MKKIKSKDIEELKSYADLFYNKEHRKKLHKKIEKNKPVIKRVFKSIKKFTNMAFTTLCYGFLLANITPMGERKTENEIEKSVELLEADDSYYHVFPICVKSKLGIDIPDFYSPLIVPYGIRYIDIVVESDLSSEAKNAAKDCIAEYNSILKAMKKDYSFVYCEDKPSHFYSIDVKIKTLSGCSVGMNTTTLPLLNGIKIDNNIWIDPSVEKNYDKFRDTLTHELLHSFGIGDKYLIENQTKTDTIMGISRNNQENYLQPNDIKYLFATLYDVKNQDDVDYVNAYIDYHMNAFKNPLIKNTLNETEREE